MTSLTSAVRKIVSLIFVSLGLMLLGISWSAHVLSRDLPRDTPAVYRDGNLDVFRLTSVHREAPQVVHLTFHGAPAAYSMVLYADGYCIIDTPDYDVRSLCQLDTIHDNNNNHRNTAVTLVTNITADGSLHLLVGPPTPIRAVRCQGVCRTTGAECQGPVCCTGYCADGKCRPWAT